MGFVYISVHSFTNVWFGGGMEYSLTLTETDDISTGMFMVYGSQSYVQGCWTKSIVFLNSIKSFLIITLRSTVAVSFVHGTIEK